VHVVLGALYDGTPDLIALAAGARVPRRGSLRFSGAKLFASPALRRRTASLLADEAPSGPVDVRGLCSEAAELKDFDAGASVATYCPSIALDRPLSSLSLVESRQLALAIALGQPEPQLVTLHHPFSAVAPELAPKALERIQELGRDTIVLCTVPAVADARRLGGSLHVLERGVLARSPAHTWPDAVTPGLETELWIECRSPRELLRELLRSHEVTRASFERERLRVSGPSLERLCEAVALAAVSTRAGVRSLEAVAPDVPSVHAATAGLASAAYHAAQSRASSGTIQSSLESHSGAAVATPREPPSEGAPP
jgi:hypothetical protein